MRTPLPKNRSVGGRTTLLGVVLISIAVSHNATAQYTLKGSSFTAVARESTGGSYSLTSTVATTGGSDTASGGSFSVTSSPWTVAVVETPGSPQLTIAAAAGSVRVIWPSPSTGWVLQQNTNGVGSVNWSNVTATIRDDGTNRTLVVSPPMGNRFYRLFKPDDRN